MENKKLSEEINHITSYDGDERIRSSDDLTTAPFTGYIELDDFPAILRQVIANLATNDFIKTTAAGFEGRSYLEVRGDLAEHNDQTGIAYTTVAGDDGKVIVLNNASPITLTIHQTADADFHCMIIQKGAGQVTVAAGGTGNVRNYDSHTKLAGQYAMGSIWVESNAGTAPEVYFSGNTAE